MPHATQPAAHHSHTPLPPPPGLGCARVCFEHRIWWLAASSWQQRLRRCAGQPAPLPLHAHTLSRPGGVHAGGWAQHGRCMPLLILPGLHPHPTPPSTCLACQATVSTNHLINTVRQLAPSYLGRAHHPHQQQHQQQQQPDGLPPQRPPEQQGSSSAAPLPPPAVPPPEVLVGDDYYAAKEQLLTAEQYVLRLTRFQLVVVHPHKCGWPGTSGLAACLAPCLACSHCGSAAGCMARACEVQTCCPETL